jgi:acetylornithine/succinyldiaminopimelate/putrescine aminotransferase
MLTTPEIAASLRPGLHAATFGGNPIAARAGIATIETIDEQKLLDQATALGEVFRQRLDALAEESQLIAEVRNLGLMIGAELTVEGGPIVQACLEGGLLVNCTQGNVIRLLPAMTLTEEQVHEGCDILADVIRKAAE